MKSSKSKPRLPAKMASRNQEIRPVGAWVEPEPYYGQQYQEAVVAAQYEEAKMQRTQAEKEERLRQFQEGVKKRVLALEKVKRQQLLEKSYRAVEVERNVLNQSARAAEKSTPRKNRCLIRDDSGLGIRHSALTNSQGCVINGEAPTDDHNFECQQKQVQEVRSQARRRLMSCKVLSEAYNPDHLPGGTWREGPTRDHPSSRHSDTSTSEYAEVYGDLEDLEHNIPILETRPKSVHFDPNIDVEETRENRISRKSVPSMVGSDVARIPSVPNIYPGVQDEEDKQLAVKQRAMYRRLFMDIEREQVKENIKRKEHRKKIQMLKKAKEEQRRLQEDESELLSAPKDPVTGETLQEMYEREREEEERIRAIEREHDLRARKEREADRYLGALKSQLREKVITQGLELPSICWCGPSVWDTNPETCANNCVFYKNPKAYAKALQSLLSSCQLN